MDHIASTFKPDGGFSLWLESDMIPVKKDWLDRLSAQWYAADEPLRIMGCLVRAILSASRRIVVDEHINGGACYAQDFAQSKAAHEIQAVGHGINSTRPGFKSPSGCKTSGLIPSVNEVRP